MALGFRSSLMTAQEALDYGIVEQVFTMDNRTVSTNTQSL
jgi:ATP-dependent protease ClpP protease subunit